MNKRILVGIVAVVTTIASGCYGAYDFFGDAKADRVWITDDGVWHAAGRSTPLWTSPAGTTWMVPGSYDGGPKFEAAATDGTYWYTSGSAGTLHFPYPEPELAQAVPVPADYDGDHRTEPAWWSRVTGTWYIEGREPVVFGTPGREGTCVNVTPETVRPSCYEFLLSDVPVPADYDGDKAAEIAVYNPVYGEWRFHETATMLKLGNTGDVPVVADYDGDGTQDPGAFDLVEGRWEVEGLGDVGVFGPPGPNLLTYPVPGDYTGDDAVELGYVEENFSPGSATWHVQGMDPLPLTGPPSAPLRIAGMPPAVQANFVRIAFTRQCSHDLCLALLDTPHDYDGDGLADPAWVNDAGEWWYDGASSPLAVGSPDDVPIPGAYRRIGTMDLAAVTSGGLWQLLDPLQTVGTAPPPTTGPGDRVWPIPADYDGDGLDEPAWYRDSDATWWIEDDLPVQFGIGGTDQVHGGHDVPVPGDYDGDGYDELVVYRPTSGTFHNLGGQTFDFDWPIGIPAPANMYRYDPGIEPAVYDPVNRGWYADALFDGFSLGETTAGIPVPARYGNVVEDRIAVAIPNGTTLEWHYIGECCETTVVTTPIGTPAAARPAVVGAMPRLTHLRQCQLDPSSCS